MYRRTIGISILARDDRLRGGFVLAAPPMRCTSSWVRCTLFTSGRRDAMPLEVKLRRRMQQLLSAVDEHETRGPRLVDDATRLWSRVRSFIAIGLAGKTASADSGAAEPDVEALELACYALQLPQRQAQPPV